jgi:hypothetical protein
MQVMLNIPDVIPQDIVNRILKQVESQLQIEEKRASQSSAVMTTSAQSAERMDQLKIGRDFMQEYHETFNALAK